MNNQNNNNSNNQKIGALWCKTSRTGDEMMSGEVTVGKQTVSIVCFKNRKDKDSHPDYVILLSNKQRPPQPRPQQQPYQKNNTSSQSTPRVSIPTNTDDGNIDLS